MSRTCSLLVDGRALVGERTGIGVHTAEIVRLLDLSPPPLLAAHREIEDRTGLEGCRFVVTPRRLGVVWQQFDLPRIARRSGCDVFWGPHGLIPFGLEMPAIVTVHDLTSITMAHNHRLQTVLSFNLLIGRSLAQARKIAAVSRSTADALVTGFGIEASKIAVVANGVDEFFSPGEVGEELPPGLERGNYFLCAGTMEPRKGIPDLIAAWESMPHPRQPLVICGGLGWGGKRVKGKASPPGLIVTGFVPRATLRALYRNCFAFVYPSHFEGFGIPPLEAMACGAPVITTRGGAIPEVVGDAALLVEPRSPDQLRAAMLRLDSATLRRELIARGFERAALFTWEKSATLMEELIEEIGS